MIEMDTHITASPVAVWKALTYNEHLAKWWGEGVTIEPFVGGKFNEPWHDNQGHKGIVLGTVTSMDAGERIQLDWRSASWTKSTRVEIMLYDEAGGTRLTLQHSGWDIFDDKTRKQYVDSHFEAWKTHLENLRKYCQDEDL